MSLFGDSILSWFKKAPVNKVTDSATHADTEISNPRLDDLALVFACTFAAFCVGAVLAGVVAWFASSIRALVTTHWIALKRHREIDEECGNCQHRSVLNSKNEPLLSQVSNAAGITAPFPEQPVHLQVLVSAERNPDAIAAYSGSKKFTYANLRAAVHDAGTLFKEVGICDGALVALYMSDGVFVVVSILGTWVAGGAWVPIDREAPTQRVATLVAECRPAAVVCDDISPFAQEKLPLLCPDQSSLRLVVGSLPTLPPRLCNSHQADVAQVIYTSGSSGVPKGVIYSHRRIAFASHFFAQRCGVESSSVVLQKTPYIWAVFRHEVFPALCRGGSLVVAGHSDRKVPKKLANHVRDFGVEVMVATPTVVDLILTAAAGNLPSLRTIACMGEGLKRDVAVSILQRLGGSVNLLNFYGSTETENTVFQVPLLSDADWQRLPKRYLPAGEPQPCVSLHILDPESFEPRLHNVVGEIFFGGVVSDGYWQRPDLTIEKFIVHPQFGRIYRTGDLGFWSQAHGLVVSGRADRQVKVRGIRVELEEVEAMLREAALCVGGKEAAAVACPSKGGGGDEDLILVGFVAKDPAIPDALNAAVVRDACEARMPPYMVPGVIEVVKSLPKLQNQKVDLQALAKMSENATENVETLDSLGMLRMLSREQLAEDVWIQNQQAFWILVVMLDHFQLNSGGANCGDVDPGNWAWRFEMSFGHGKDMVAFILMVGFTDSRDPIRFGTRDRVLLCLALLMSGPLSYILSPGYGPLQSVFSPPSNIGYVGHSWFLFSVVFARIALQTFHRMGLRPSMQVVVMFLAAFLIPDDLWARLLPLSSRTWLWVNNAGVTYKGLRWITFFVTATYLLGFHGGSPAIRLARKWAPRQKWKKICLAVGCCAAYVAMSVTTGDVNVGYPSYQAVFDEASSSKLVTWSYMTHPSFAIYTTLWVSELALFLMPPMFVAIAMAYCPVHFKTLGTTSLGNYVLHPYYIGAPWLAFFQGPILSRITSPVLGVILNICVITLWNVTFCIGFAFIVCVPFHHILVGSFTQVGKVFSNLCVVKRTAYCPRPKVGHEQQ